MYMAAAFSTKLFGQAYNLTGPDALDHSQIAGIVGKAITYHALPEEAMLQGSRNQGMPESSVKYMAVHYQAIRAGYMGIVNPDVEDVAGTG